MGGGYPRKRAQSDIGSNDISSNDIGTTDSTEDMRVLLREKQKEVEAQKLRIVDLEKENLQTQLDAEKRLTDAEKRVNAAEKRVNAVQREYIDPRLLDRADKQLADAEKRIAETKADADKRIAEAKAEVEKRVEEFKEWMRDASRRADKAQEIALDVSKNMRLAVGAFHSMATQSLRIVDKSQERVPHLITAQKLISSHQDQLESYGVQIVREEADSQHLDVSRYSLLEGTQSGIEEEVGTRMCAKVGKFVPTTNPDKFQEAFIKGGQALLNSKTSPPTGVVPNVKPDGSSWSWMSCGAGNLIEAHEFESALEQAVENSVKEEDSMQSLSEELSELVISVMKQYVDIKNAYTALETKVWDVENIYEELRSSIASILDTRSK